MSVDRGRLEGLADGQSDANDPYRKPRLRDAHLLTALFESLARVFFEGIRIVGSKGLSSVPTWPSSLEKPRDAPRVQFSK